MNLASFVNKVGGNSNKIVDKTSPKPQQAESIESNSICADETCACNWKPEKKASFERRKPGLDNSWRGN